MRIPLWMCLILLPATAQAGAWTRDQGHFYLNLNYSRIAAQRYFNIHGDVISFGAVYEQQVLSHYAEVGILSRWLTAMVEWQAYRNGSLTMTDATGAGARGVVDGVGDLRVGAWSGLVVRPVHFSLGVIVGFPLGDPQPAGSTADEQAFAHSLPTGDGEFDVEVRGALGHSFGGWRRWPLQHYVVAELGYFGRTISRAVPDKVFPSDITYKLELGIKLPWRFIDRFWFIARLSGIEALLTQALIDDPGSICQSTAAFSGLGACVAYTAYGFDVFGRIFKGLGASIGLDSAFRAHLVAAGANLRVALSYEY